MEPFLPSLEQIRQIQSTVWTFFCFWCVMVDPCFVNSDETPQKLFRIALKHVQTVLRSCHAIPFVFQCEQTRHPSRRQLSHVSCRTFCMRSVEIFTMLAISLIFTRRSANTI